MVPAKRWENRFLQSAAWLSFKEPIIGVQRLRWYVKRDKIKTNKCIEQDRGQKMGRAGGGSRGGSFGGGSRGGGFGKGGFGGGKR